jgi:hypothetical protein
VTPPVTPPTPSKRRAGRGQIAGAAPDRTRRLARTIVLGALAVFAGIAWLTRELGMDAAELRGFALTSMMLVAGVIVLALAGAAALRLARRLRR